MKRQVTMEEISDGKLYTSNDLVKADCGDCEGCHACCTGMGSSIVLDPLDIVRICRGTGAAFETLLAGRWLWFSNRGRKMWDSSISSGNLPAFPAWKIL